MIWSLLKSRDPLEPTLAAGSILLPQETRRGRLAAAAVPVHLGLSVGWAVVLARLRVTTPLRGAAAGVGIAALDLRVVGRLFPRIGALPVLPQLADHAAYGATVGCLLARRRR
jgi:hypothetical protein